MQPRALPCQWCFLDLPGGYDKKAGDLIEIPGSVGSIYFQTFPLFSVFAADFLNRNQKTDNENSADNKVNHYTEDLPSNSQIQQ